MDNILDPLKMSDEELNKWIPVFKVQIESITVEMRNIKQTIGWSFLYDILKKQLDEKTDQLKKAESVLEFRQESMR